MYLCEDEILYEISRLSEYEKELDLLYDQCEAEDAEEVYSFIRRIEYKIATIQDWLSYLSCDERLIVTLRLVQNCTWNMIESLYFKGAEHTSAEMTNDVMLIFDKSLKRIAWKLFTESE